MNILKSAFTVSSWTGASRVLGFLRDVTIANKLGTSAASDAFFVAMLLPNLLRRLFGEGAFNVAFIPIATRIQQNQDKAAMQEFAGMCLGLLAVVLGVIVILGEIFMPAVVTLVAPGYAADPEKLALTSFLGRITFPYLMLITYATLAGAILNSLNIFKPFAMVPVFLNLALLAGLWILPLFNVEPVFAASIAVPLGGVWQALYMRRHLQKSRVRLKFIWQPKHDKIQQLLRRIGPAALAIGVLQLSFMIDNQLASLLGDKSISYLNYANRFYQFPLSLIGIAMATVLLPHFSRALEKGDKEMVKDTFNQSLTQSIALALACTVGLSLLGHELIGTMFGHGKFTENSVNMAAWAMVAYSVGLPGYVTTKVCLSAFYANEDTKTPIKISIAALVVNLIFNLILMQYFAHVGIALATAIAGYVNACLQIWYLKRLNVVDIPLDSRFFTPLFKAIGISAVMFVMILGYKLYVPYGEHFITKMVWLITAGGLGLGIFLALSHKLGMFDVKLLVQKLRAKV